jgi:UDPglucose 6-dehydrogenase
MKIAVIGTGYVGLVLGTCLSDLGNEITCCDIDQEKINKLNNGVVPIFEPGLKEMLGKNIKQGRIKFTIDTASAIKDCEVIFIAVGTPEGKDHKADLSAVFAIAKLIGENINGYKVIVDKSTVPVGTGANVKRIVKENNKDNHEFDVVSNPEFLKEGDALNDFMVPDRIVIGAESERAREVMGRIYKGITRVNRPVLFTNVESAEMIKYASNAMLATRISFMNEVAQLCEKTGADVKAVAKGMGLDNRIGPRFLQAGVGYGGSCFPKDVKAFIQTMKENGVEGKIMDAVEAVNVEQKKFLLPKIVGHYGDVKDKTFAVWGMAFKPKTDDMREAPSITIINELQKLGAKIKAFDPEAQERAKEMLKDIEICQSPHFTLKDADGLIIVTEWNEFRDIDMNNVKGFMKNPVVFDGRNIYEPEEMRKMGFTYYGVGR